MFTLICYLHKHRFLTAAPSGARGRLERTQRHCRKTTTRLNRNFFEICEISHANAEEEEKKTRHVCERQVEIYNTENNKLCVARNYNERKLQHTLMLPLLLLLQLQYKFVVVETKSKKGKTKFHSNKTHRGQTALAPPSGDAGGGGHAVRVEISGGNPPGLTRINKNMKHQ